MTTARQRWLALALAAAGAAEACGQAATREARVAYVYPAGGRQGTTFQVTAGGLNLQGVTNIYVSGEGVHIAAGEYLGRFRGLDSDQQRELRKRVDERRRKLAPPGTATPPAPPAQARPAADAKPVTLPDHPLLRNLDKLSLVELDRVANEFLITNRKQPISPQMVETMLLRVTISKDAAPGVREVRLGTLLGLTNPLRLEVDALPEVLEHEPFDALSPAVQSVSLPTVLNGQILAGDVDRFRFKARRGQQIVVEARARQLIPYLADAVPGWFQATLALYDAAGNEIAFTDDYRFNPDPVLVQTIPADGDYDVEIRDAIYRGREDFVYRIVIGEQPFVTRVFPLGGRAGVPTVATIAGWNLPGTRLSLDMKDGGDAIREAVVRQRGLTSSPLHYAVDELPGSDETEPNDHTRAAQVIALPRIVNGRIGRAGDTDVFRFTARADTPVVAEVYGRRLDSPLDSLLRLTDTSGRVIAWNDDWEDRECGWLTHHADAYLMARVPKDGTYYLNLTDSQGHGGDDHAYRLRVGPPDPDFALRISPSSVNAQPGRPVPLTVHVLRKDGFDGEIEIALRNAPTGVTLSGARVPGTLKSMRLTMVVPGDLPARPVTLQFEGRARIGGKSVTRPVVPAEDMMQAFAYRHLVPSESLLLLAVGYRRQGPPPEVVGEGPVRVPIGGTAKVEIRNTSRPGQDSTLSAQLVEPPPGLTIREATVTTSGLSLVLAAESGKAVAGYADNLIVEAFADPTPARESSATAKPRFRYGLGTLPAIPIVVVQR